MTQKSLLFNNPVEASYVYFHIFQNVGIIV